MRAFVLVCVRVCVCLCEHALACVFISVCILFVRSIITLHVRGRGKISPERVSASLLCMLCSLCTSLL